MLNSICPKCGKFGQAYIETDEFNDIYSVCSVCGLRKILGQTKQPSKVLIKDKVAK